MVERLRATLGSPTRTRRRVGMSLAVCTVVGLLLAAWVLLSRPASDRGGQPLPTVPPPELPEDPAASPRRQGTPWAHGVPLRAGDDFQAVVDSHPPGTRYRIESGTHRMQEVVPDDGDVFVGEPGAVLSGARDISFNKVRWTAEAGWWYVDGQTQRGSVRGRIRQGGNYRDRHPEELFVTGRRFEHVATIGELGEGRWYFDYANDRIWLGQDPARLRLIEASVTSAAFRGRGVEDVVIDNLVIEKYASPAQRGAIAGHTTRRWTLRYLEVRDNHGGGIGVGPGMTIKHCAVHHNGEIGLIGSGIDTRLGDDTGYTHLVDVRHNEIARNLVLDYDPSWEGGGTKLARMYQGMVVEQNWVHDNYGHGLWMDIENFDVTVRSNLVENNMLKGIFYEIGYGPHPAYGGGDTRIHWNIVRDNGWGTSSERKAIGIHVSNSRDVRVFENLLYGNPSGIMLLEDGEREPHVADIRVYRNGVHFTYGSTGLEVVDHPDGEAGAFFSRSNIVFRGNAYRLDDEDADRFAWRGSQWNFQRWQQLGNDAGGMVIDSSARLELPPGAVPFAYSHYGPTR